MIAPALSFLLPFLATLSLFTSTEAKAVYNLTNSLNPLLLNDVKTLFAFGDSYSSVGYHPARGFDPRKGQDIATTSGGYNWLQYLASSAGLNESFYDFAYPGSSIEPTVLQKGRAPNPSLVNQTDVFLNYFANMTKVDWDPASSLFVVATGINDIANSVLYHRDYLPTMERLAEIYVAQLDRMYERGARHFVLLPVPPFDRTPLAVHADHEDTAKFIKWVHAWNFRFSDLVEKLPQRFPDIEVRVWDVHEVLDEMLDNAEELGFKEKLYSCWPYAMFRSFNPMAEDSGCAHPLREYFWKDDAHPSWPVHKLMAEQALDFLRGIVREKKVHDKRERRMVKVGRGAYHERRWKW